MATRWQEFTFSAATTPPTVAAAQEVTCLAAAPDTVSASTSLGTQFLSLAAVMSTAAASATILVLLVDDDQNATPAGAGIFRAIEFTVTATSVRQDHAGNAGGYVATVVGALNPGTNVADLFGFGKTAPRVYIACTVLSAGTITVWAAPGRAI